MKVPLKDVVWETVKYIKTSDAGPVEDHIHQHELLLPSFLASWDVWDYWERERTESMEQHLKKGDVLFDIGTEVGWLSIIYGRFVGPENMVLIEPTPDFWANIRATWRKNFDTPPLASFNGLFSNKSDAQQPADYYGEGDNYPEAAERELIDKLAYTYIHENNAKVPEITIDDYVKRTGIVPDALTMDTEGAELFILQGAEETLRTHKPMVWASIHPDLGERDYGVTKQDVLDFMEALGYEAEYLATDHEEHYYFSHPERA